MLNYRQKQQGVALVIAMIFLVVLTLIGVTSMRTSSMEEKMTANQKDYYMAFESAEYALREAEGFLDGLDSTEDFSAAGTNGLYRNHDLSDRVWTDDLWGDENGTKVKVVSSSSLPGNWTTKVKPEYIVEFIKEVEPGGDDLQLDNDYGKSYSASKISVFRVTARGMSGKGSVVFLQSTYSRVL